MEDDYALWDFLRKIVGILVFMKTQRIDNLQEDFGVCFIRGVPATTDETEQLALRISRIRHTQCKWNIAQWLLILMLYIADGGFWDFTSDLAKGDTAYTTLALGAHTDTTYFVKP